MQERIKPLSLQCHLSLIAYKTLENKIIQEKHVNAWVTGHSTQSSCDMALFWLIADGDVFILPPKQGLYFHIVGCPRKVSTPLWGDHEAKSPRFHSHLWPGCMGANSAALSWWEGRHTLSPLSITATPASHGRQGCMWKRGDSAFLCACSVAPVMQRELSLRVLMQAPWPYLIGSCHQLAGDGGSTEDQIRKKYGGNAKI